MLPEIAIMQTYHCSDTSRPARANLRNFKAFGLCFDCKKESGLCRFISKWLCLKFFDVNFLIVRGKLDCRYILPDQPNKAHFYHDKEVKEPIYPQFSPKQDKKAVNAKKARSLSFISTVAHYVFSSLPVRGC